MADYIPGPDASFQATPSRIRAVASQLRVLSIRAGRPCAAPLPGANANLAALGLIDADMTPVTSAKSARLALNGAASAVPIPRRIQRRCARSKRSRFITLTHAATKSRTNVSIASAHA